MPRRTIDELLADARSRIRRLGPEEALAAAEAGALLVDTRSREARERDGVIPGSLHLPRTVLEWRVDPDSPWRNEHVGGLDRQLVVVCEEGFSSSLAAAVLVELGFERAGDLVGGFEAWKAAGLPVAPAPPEPDDGRLAGAGGSGAVRLGVEAALVDGSLVRGDVEVDGGRVAAVGLGGGGRGTAVPGFVDLHVHGFGGVDFSQADADGYRRAGEALLETGVTAFQPSLITAPEEELVAALRELPSGEIGPRVLGCHLEGPFISPARLGMHPAASRRDPEHALLERLLAAGPVSHVTLAPELPGGLELVEALVARGVTAACGHTDATAGEAHAAFDRGAAHVTHLFNAMRPFAHRDPGLAGAALARPDVTVELILDGHHLADEAARLALQAAPGRVVAVTDALAAAGVGDGSWHLGGVEVEVRDGVARMAGGVLAGSVLTMHRALLELVRLGATLEQAVDAATRVPARVARRPDLGTLAPGSPADVVVLDGELAIRRVLVAGSERVAA